MRGLTGQFVLELLGLGDVAGDGGVVLYDTVVRTDDLQHDRHRAHDAVWSAEADLAIPLVQRGRRLNFTWKLVEDRTNEKLCRRVVVIALVDTDQRARTFVGEQGLAARVEHHDRITR